MAAIRRLIGGDSPERICIDIAHTYAIAGYGKDELASLLIFLAVRCNVWGNAAWEIQLERAYESFSAWCAQKRKTSTILEFSKKELKIASLLDYKVHAYFCAIHCCKLFLVDGCVYWGLVSRPKAATVPKRIGERK